MANYVAVLEKGKYAQRISNFYFNWFVVEKIKLLNNSIMRKLFRFFASKFQRSNSKNNQAIVNCSRKLS